MNTIYFAGGCFWGLEYFFTKIPGVVSTRCGYANGQSNMPLTYESVCGGLTGARETVKIEYNPSVVSLTYLTYTFLAIIDPTVSNRQGVDVGSQYQTGIYYTDNSSKEVIERIAMQKKKYISPFMVEILPLKSFVDAEEYHQKYLEKNPGGYCHIPRKKAELFSRFIVDPGKYSVPTQQELSSRLTPLQYDVTQNGATEPPFNNEYWNHFEKGIYVDITTGEPLFSSLDKYESCCGWPTFSKPIESNVIFNVDDFSLGTYRIEVKSRLGDAHLGHLFHDDLESDNGDRYCINSAALRFIPYENMAQEGYSDLLRLFQ